MTQNSYTQSSKEAIKPSYAVGWVGYPKKLWYASQVRGKKPHEARNYCNSIGMKIPTACDTMGKNAVPMSGQAYRYKDKCYRKNGSYTLYTTDGKGYRFGWHDRRYVTCVR